MKKNNLYVGIIYTVIGLAFLAFALWGPEIRLTPLFWGLGGAGLGPGLLLLCRYIHFSSPKHTPEYKKLVKTAQIQSQDERHIMLQDKSGRICYSIFLYILAGLSLLFTILYLWDITVPTKYLIFLFSGLLLAHFIGGTLIYQILDKRL